MDFVVPRLDAAEFRRIEKAALSLGVWWNAGTKVALAETASGGVEPGSGQQA